MASNKRPSKRAKKASEGDIYEHLKDGCCIACLIRPSVCDVTWQMCREAWPKYRQMILDKWSAEGNADPPWGWTEFEGLE